VTDGLLWKEKISFGSFGPEGEGRKRGAGSASSPDASDEDAGCDIQVEVTDPRKG